MTYQFLACLFIAVTLLQQSQAQLNATVLNIPVIGRSFWPPSVNLLEELVGGAVAYSDQSISSCLTRQDVSESPSSFIFYENNNEVYRRLGGNLGVNIQVSVASIAATIASVSDINFRSTSVQATQLDYGQFVAVYDLSDSCLTGQDFDERFMNELLTLPSELNDTTAIDSYVDYEQFATLFGGFVVTRITVGARMQMFASARSSLDYTSFQFNNRLCAQITIPVDGVPVNIGPCIGFDADTLRESLMLEMSVTRHLRGGNRTLQAELSTGALNATILQNYIDSATSNPFPVDYELTPLWELYTGNDPVVRNRLSNLQNYFTLLTEAGRDNNSNAAKFAVSLMLLALLVFVSSTMIV